MKYTWKAAMGLTLFSFLLGGCQTHLPDLSSTQAVIASPPITEQALPEENPTEDVQNVKEMQLVMFSQELLLMDRHTNLSITAKQAETILPLVRKSIDEGSMNESERKLVLGGLTADQIAFLEEQSKQEKARFAERAGNQGDELSSEEREKRVKAFMQKRKTDRQAESDFIDREHGENQFDPRSMGISVEQQLMELLMSKL
ncbi:hypothetical protein HZF08_16890 [Paenibacillus sp. CGMCC 1.16610]|uniref:Lipoprotein n=1 Tax=Paenibacillus anseongense TaxID=2682845 RepID=A0ABW9UI83_9BACL|nr:MULTISPECIES: hypothetical protein [Paenibacillus]MBA2939990.1 hypothetical protein [Paenibacillus sp. CGMCC 1.16610]MVQ38945.1 hypothetical protein [Paenibacillus anseongense]